MKILFGLLLLLAMTSVLVAGIDFPRCLQPHILPGPQCLAYIPRYYFDKKTKSCKQFIYGGCRGTGNNFATIEDCQATCICYLAGVTGPCKAAMPGYYYDSSARECKKFIFGGCDANGNIFRSKRICDIVCPRSVPCVV